MLQIIWVFTVSEKYINAHAGVSSGGGGLNFTLIRHLHPDCVLCFFSPFWFCKTNLAEEARELVCLLYCIVAFVYI